MMQSAFCFRKKNTSFSVSLFFCGGSTRSASADFVWIRERTSLRSQTLIIEAWRRRKSSQKRNVEPGADDDAATAIGDAPSPRRHLRCCPLPAPPARGLRLLAPGHPLSHAHLTSWILERRIATVKSATRLRGGGFVDGVATPDAAGLLGSHLALFDDDGGEEEEEKGDRQQRPASAPSPPPPASAA